MLHVGSRLGAEDHGGQDVSSESGHWLPDLRDCLVLLPASSRHPLPLLEDLPDSAQEDQEEGHGGDFGLRPGAERRFWRRDGW